MKTKRANRLLALLLALVMVIGMLPMTALAAPSFSVTVDDVQITSTYNGSKFTYDYTISEDNANITVSGSTTNGRIIVNADNVTINLNNASMLLSYCNGSPIEIAEGKTATIVLSGENKLTAYAAGPGILVNQGATLVIKEAENSSGGNNSLTVNGAQTESYFDDGGMSGGLASGFAGIGGPNSRSALTYTGTIKIESGIVSAFGYGYGAGIGGGDYSSGGTIEISGGKVTAINGGTDPNGWGSNTHKQASGIGASQGQHSGTITISGNAEVTAYGGSACAGIGGGQNNITIKDNAKVTAYGGTYAAGIGGYNQNKGESTITISNSAKVTAYGGAGASGLGQGSNNAASVKLTIGPSATVLAYSDGTKAAITGTPQTGSANIINMYMQNVNLGSGDIPLTLTSAGNDSQTITLAGGYKGVGKTFLVGSYDVTVPTEEVGSNYRLLPYSGNSFKVVASDNEAAYSGTRLMLMLVSDNGATIQLNPPNGTTVKSGSEAPLVLDEKNGTIVIPAGGTVDENPYPLGGTLEKNGTFTPTAVKYEVWVAGTQITSVNKDDVLNDGGSVKYDPATKTLTLTNATIKNTNGSGIEAKGNITIHGVDTEAAGTNAITGSTHAIQTIGGDIKITGTLGDITGGSDGGITATVTTTGNNPSVGGNILVDKGAAIGDITSDWYTLQADKGSITINGEIGDIFGQIGITSEGNSDTIINGKVGDITGVEYGIFSYGKLTINEDAQVGNISGGIFGAIAMDKISIESIIGTVKSNNSAAILGAKGIELGEKVAIKIPKNNKIDVASNGLYTVYDTEGTKATIAKTVEFATVYTVSFDSKGGSDVASQAIVDGQTAVKPANPTRDSYTFAGWCSDEDCTTSYDFANAVTADITLYAKWNLNITPVVPGDTVRYIVEHYKADSTAEGGYTLAETEYPAGKIGATVTATAKTYEGFTYNATKSTANGTLKAITSDADIVTLKLYYDVTNCTLSFDTNDGSKIDSIQKAYGTTVDLAGYTPSRDGYDFSGWYSDKNLSEKITSVRLTDDKTVYAKWTKKAVSPKPDETNPNTGSDTTSPQTGDNSNMCLWIALLFVSGGAITTLTVYDRKKKKVDR